MKKIVLLVAPILLALAVAGFAEGQNPSNICLKCDLYGRVGNVRGFFENIWLQLEDDMREGPIDRKSGKIISKRNLGELWVIVSVHLSCVERDCPDHPQLSLFRKQVHRINTIINSGRICSP